mgnify:CR=1 FL=1
MPSSEHKAVLQRYLNSARDALMWKAEGLSDYDLRRPLTASGTNILGVIKHLASVDMGYFTDVFGRECPVSFPWFEPDAQPNDDLYATPNESKEFVFDLMATARQVTNDTIEALDLDDVGRVAWWGPEGTDVTLHTIMVHMLAEYNRHGGHIDIVRELIDNQIGYRDGATNLPSNDSEWWSDYLARVNNAASHFLP